MEGGREGGVALSVTVSPCPGVCVCLGHCAASAAVYFQQQHNNTYELLGKERQRISATRRQFTVYVPARTLVVLNASVLPGATRDGAELVPECHGAVGAHASVATVNMLGTSRGFGQDQCPARTCCPGVQLGRQHSGLIRKRIVGLQCVSGGCCHTQ